MLAYIKGSLEMKNKNYIVIDVGGLGYKIFMSENAINSLGEIGEIIKVHTYYRVREDDISIYGFKTQEELRMFELLISVSGVGAKSALVMLSCIEPSDFAIAVISNDVKVLIKRPEDRRDTNKKIENIDNRKVEIKKLIACDNNTMMYVTIDDTRKLISADEVIYISQAYEIKNAKYNKRDSQVSCLFCYGKRKLFNKYITNLLYT